jgi:hypothetical protein
MVPPILTLSLHIVSGQRHALVALTMENCLCTPWAEDCVETKPV